jgi:hypothetical protein
MIKQTQTVQILAERLGLTTHVSVFRMTFENPMGAKFVARIEMP